MKRTVRCLLGLLTIAIVGCRQSGAVSESSETSASAAKAEATTPAATSGSDAQVVALPGGLKYQDLKVGDGALAESGKTVSVHYTGWLTDGTKFDSSLDHGKPLDFQLGAGNVIRGWDEGVKGMRVGGKRRLTIPPDLAYGSAGAPGAIPPDATLLFEVELLAVR